LAVNVVQLVVLLLTAASVWRSSRVISSCQSTGEGGFFVGVLESFGVGDADGKKMGDGVLIVLDHSGGEHVVDGAV
jgi:hypothetical protein